MTQKHTPTPWVLPEGYETLGQIMGEIPIRTSSEPDAVRVATCKAKENRRTLSDNIVADAEFIVRACNAHDELFECLRLALGDIKDAELAVRATNALAKARGEA